MKEKSKKAWCVFCVLVLSLGILPCSWAAEEDKVRGKAAVSVSSAYIWRG